MQVQLLESGQIKVSVPAGNKNMHAPGNYSYQVKVFIPKMSGDVRKFGEWLDSVKVRSGCPEEALVRAEVKLNKRGIRKYQLQPGRS